MNSDYRKNVTVVYVREKKQHKRAKIKLFGKKFWGLAGKKSQLKNRVIKTLVKFTCKGQNQGNLVTQSHGATASLQRSSRSKGHYAFCPLVPNRTRLCQPDRRENQVVSQLVRYADKFLFEEVW